MFSVFPLRLLAEMADEKKGLSNKDRQLILKTLRDIGVPRMTPSFDAATSPSFDPATSGYVCVGIIFEKVVRKAMPSDLLNFIRFIDGGPCERAVILNSLTAAREIVRSV
jgi:hypothetical protein